MFEREGRTDFISSERIGEVLANTQIGLAMILACESARVGGATLLSGLAPGLVLAGVPAVIGVRYAEKVAAGLHEKGKTKAKVTAEKGMSRMPRPSKQTASSGSAARVRKLAEMAATLQDGSQSYFYVTRLTSIKRLCRTGDSAMRFALYLAELTLARMMAIQPPSTDWATDVQPPAAAADLTLATAAVRTMRHYLDAPTPEGLNAVRAVLGQVSQVQSEIVRLMPGESPVRLIHSSDLLLIEDALRCFIAVDDAAQAGEWAYQTARVYAERFNPAYGTGLLRESAPFLADIVRFWSEYYG